MYKKIADHISESLVASGAIPGSELKVYSYAAELFLSSITGLVICIGIGMLFGSPIGSILFLAVYCPLRQFSGGYHAANHISCAVIFCLVFLSNTFVAHYFIIVTPFTPLAIFAVAVMSVTTIYALSPIEDKNKPLTQNEKDRFKKRSMLLSLAALILVAILLKLELLEASYFACSAVLILSILLVMGKIKNMKGEKMKKKFSKSTPLMAAVLMTLVAASVNSASWWMIYQPEVPKELLKEK